MTRHDHDDSDEHKRHDAAKGPPGEKRQEPEKQKAFPEKDRHTDEVDTHTRPENQTNAAPGADISDREKRRPSHRADLTRNLRHPPHMGRRTPFSTMLFDNGNGEPPGGPATRRSAGRYSLRHMAAMLMIIVAGGIGGAAMMKATLSHQSASPDFFTSLPMTASRAYRLYANDKEHPVEVSADQKDHLAGWLNNRLGLSFSIPDLSSKHFQLLGGRVVPIGDTPGALLMYENNQNQRIVIFIARNPHNSSVDFSTWNTAEQKAFYWVDGPIGYAVSGTPYPAQLKDIALVVYRQTGG